tara:strand:+ start:60524 stop:61267 length:744 start_codon:yes stop_codon:yes gene_type:complete
MEGKNKKFGLIGKKIGYSFSQSFFQKKFKNENILNCSYENFELKSIDEVNNIFNLKNIHGLNVTIPYKESIIKYLDDLDPISEKIGAVNTICFNKQRKTIGYNTDCHGFEVTLKPFIKKKINKALILGTGGASKAVKYVLGKYNIKTTLVSRSPVGSQISYNEINKNILIQNKMIINCTPVGTFPNIDEYPNINYSYLSKNNILIDLIYNPKKTKFIKKGLKKGCLISNGEKMLINQAEKSWILWNK